jgi:arylformamidase
VLSSFVNLGPLNGGAFSFGPAMIASSRDFHAYRAQSHLPGQLIPVVKTNHFTILEELRRPNAILTRAVSDLAEQSA